jgi:hypothetical protein
MLSSEPPHPGSLLLRGGGALQLLLFCLVRCACLSQRALGIRCSRFRCFHRRRQLVQLRLLHETQQCHWIGSNSLEPWGSGSAPVISYLDLWLLPAAANRETGCIAVRLGTWSACASASAASALSRAASAASAAAAMRLHSASVRRAAAVLEDASARAALSACSR